jgi:hypothetical protein
MKYMIAPGKSFTTPHCGIVSEYQEVTPKKIGSMFDALVKSGAIVELSSRPQVVHSINLRPERYKHVDTGNRTLNAPAVAEVKKVEVIEPIKKKDVISKKKKEEIEEVENIEEINLDEPEKDLF